ncbi:MAG: hypothetical protein IKP77_06185 [Acholeplasmatales bacterium]|nr:hypothetical protein [Acholeplasmatales bacterium]
MVRQILRINKMVFYIPIGIIIIVMREHLINYLSLIVGIPMLIVSIEGLIYEIAIHSYKTEHNRIGEEIIKIILSVLIIFAFDNNVEIISIIWGVIAILQAVKELSKAIYELTYGGNPLFLLLLLQTIIQIIFAILLIIEPEEHVSLHLVLLGVEMELESSRILFTFIYNYKRRRIKLDSDMVV